MGGKKGYGCGSIERSVGISMFDVQTFFDAYGILYRYGEGRKGPELKVQCPICAGNQKLWCSLQDETAYCHKCTWTPRSIEDFVRKFVKANPFQVDLIVHKFRKRDERRNVSDVIDEITGNPSLDVSLARFEGNGEPYQSFLKGFTIEEEEPPPLEWPPYYLPLGDSRISQVNLYAASRGFSFKLLSKHKFGGCSLGRYSGCLIVPAINEGKLMFWQARDALGRNYDEFPKYRTPLGYSANRCLFNLDEAVQHEVVVICEGVFSALRTGKEAVATFGNKISPQQVKILVDRGVKKVVLCYDPDTWTIPKAMLDRGITNLKPPIYLAATALLQSFETVRVVKLVDGDPDEVGTAVIRRMIYESRIVQNKMDLVLMM